MCSLIRVFKLVCNQEGSGLLSQPGQKMQLKVAEVGLAWLAEISSYTATVTSL